MIFGRKITLMYIDICYLFMFDILSFHLYVMEFSVKFIFIKLVLIFLKGLLGTGFFCRFVEGPYVDFGCVQLFDRVGVSLTIIQNTRLLFYTSDARFDQNSCQMQTSKKLKSKKKS